jgi:HD-like signal output (HDOD) protein/CheY-like chemotaxis protein
LKRILFVDDDSNVLGGLARLLRPMRHEWTTVFACGGAEAISMLQSQHFDVIVTDMRMPLMDGKALLTHVHEQYPEIIRIVLSGHTEVSSALAIVPLAHQFLSKPCKTDELKTAVERAGRVRDMLSDERIRRITGSVDRLPTPPAVYTKLTQLLSQPEFTLDDVANIMETDPAMCAKILHLVNSSFFGSARSTTNVRDAIYYLGTNMVRNLVTGVAMVEVFATNRLPPGFSPEQIGREGQLVGGLARIIMKGNRLRADEAYAAGLLHDVGHLVLGAYAPELFALACTRAKTDDLPLHQAEVEIYGVTHAEVGAYLLALWGLPWSIVEAVGHHHSAPSISSTTLEVSDAVYLANVVVQEALLLARQPEAERTPRRALPLDQAYLAKLGIAQRVAGWQHAADELLGGERG